MFILVFKDKYASLFAGVHVRSSACMSVSLFFFLILTFVTEPVVQFQQQQKAKSILGKWELKSVKMNGDHFFQER